MSTTACRTIYSFPEPSIEAAWRAFLGSANGASHFASPEYFLEPLDPRDKPLAILAEEDGAVTGVLTGVLRGRGLTSGMPHRPQLALSSDPTVAARAMEAMSARFLKEGEHHLLLTLYSYQVQPALETRGFRTRPLRGTLVLDLTASEEELFRGFSTTKRRVIRQAERRGMVVRDEYDDAAIDGYVTAIQQTDRRHHRPPHPRASIDAILALPKNRKLFLAYLDDRLLAGTVVRFQPGGLAEYSENASLDDARAHHPNEYLMWKAICWCRRAGCPSFSFGGANHFKVDFGGLPQPVYRHRRDRSFLRMTDRREALELRLRAVARRVLRRTRR